MKNPVQEEKHLGQKDPHWDSINKTAQYFPDFWKKCKKIASRDEIEASSLEKGRSLFSGEVHAFKSSYIKFIDLVRDVPLASAIGSWIEGICTDEIAIGRYIQAMTDLVEKKIIPFFDAGGNIMTLGHLRLTGHQDILEQIRCVPDWSIFEKLEKVECYVRFSHSLAQSSFNFIPHGFDPDRHRVYHREVKYESFIEFIQKLSKRDSLIAELIYFGAPSIEEVLNLKQAALDLQKCEIHYQEKSIRYPRHLVWELHEHVKERQEPKGLLFTNVRNAPVERSHLNQSFARACEKMKKREKITPGSLLKIKDKN